MRILFSSVSPAHYMAPPQLADEQINCGPFFKDMEIGGRIVSMATPQGEYDLAALVTRLPTEQQPDAVVCLVDSSLSNVPRNIAAFDCPKIVLVADTHHMGSPLTGMIRYLTSETYDRVVFLYTRHHIELFRAAGVRNLHWFPSLTLPLTDVMVGHSVQPRREARIAMVGQMGTLHQRRVRCACALAVHKLPIALKSVPQRDGMGFYGSSLLGLNVTANGDLNLRAFEIMASGAMQLMDRLAPESGVGQLWQDGREIVTYGSIDELVERAKYYLSRPEEARRIGSNGAAWYAQHFSEHLRRSAFHDLVFNGRSLPQFELEEGRTRISFEGNPSTVLDSIIVYEHLQQLHSEQETVQVLLDESVPRDFETICATLPRIRVTRLSASPGGAISRPDLLVVGRMQVFKPMVLTARRVWCWNARVEDKVALNKHFESAGLIPEKQPYGFYSRQAEPDSRPSDQMATAARARLLQGNANEAFEFARRALEQNPRSLEAHLVMAELALDLDDTSLHGKMMLKARSLAPKDPRIALLDLTATRESGTRRLPRRMLLLSWHEFDQRHLEKAVSIASSALKLDPQLADLHYVKGLASLELSRNYTGIGSWRLQGSGLNSLRTAAELAPGRDDIWQDLAISLRVAGLFREAAAAFRIAVGIEPGNGLGWFGLGESLLMAGSLDSASEALEQGLAQAPGDCYLARVLGHVRKRQGRLLESWQWHCRSFGAEFPVNSAGSSRRKAIFIVQHPQAWNSTASVYAAFAADPAWETRMVALPYFHPFYTANSDDKDAIFGFLKQLGLPFERWDNIDLRAGCADVVFLQNPYDITRPRGWRTGDLLHRGLRIVYIPYGIEIGGGVDNALSQFNLPTQQLAWAIFARSERHRAMFAKYCHGGNAHVHVTGHPKLDALKDLEGLLDPELQAFAGGRKLVVWNPQFDVRLNGTAFGAGYSTFLRWVEFLPDEFARRPNMAFVIRPHPLFFATMEDRGILNSKQIERFLARCSTAGNILIDRRHSYLPVFAAAAAMISDASSFLIEFGVTGKPLLYLHNPYGPSLNEDGEFVRSYCATAESEAEITRFLDDVAAGHDPRRKARRDAQPEFMHLPEEGVGRKIKSIIDSRLSTERAETLAALPAIGQPLGSEDANPIASSPAPAESPDAGEEKMLAEDQRALLVSDS